MRVSPARYRILVQGGLDSRWSNRLGGLEITVTHLEEDFVVTQLSGYFGTALAAEATLSYLGLGVPPPFPSWGRMIQEGTQGFLEAAPWMTMFPATALFVCILSFAFLGDGLRDLLDPNSR